MRGRALLLLLPPAVAFAVGRWAPRQASPVQAGPSVSAAEVDTAPDCPPAGSPRLAALEVRYAEHQAQVQARTIAFEDALYDAVEQCDIDVEVAEIDCSEAPCMALVLDEADAWAAARRCEPWLALHGDTPDHGVDTTYECADGRRGRLRIVTGRNPGRDDAREHFVVGIMVARRGQEIARGWDDCPQSTQ